MIKAVKSTNPDAFIAWSYPPDTFGLTDQAKIENLNVKVYYNGIGCAFAGFYGKYGASAENVIGFGGIPDNEKTRAFLKLHKEVTGVDSDYNACPYYYANGQVLRQAFEGAGTMDRDAITEYLKSHTFKTLIGEIDLRSQLQNIAYTVGQWQNGFFHSVAGVGVRAIRTRGSAREDRLGVSISARRRLAAEALAITRQQLSSAPGDTRPGDDRLRYPAAAVIDSTHRACSSAVDYVNVLYYKAVWTKSRPVRALALFALSHFPLIEPGADLGEVICRLCETHGPALLDRDVVVVAQKVVSKAEGRYVDLAAVKPGEHALALAEQVQKDPRLVEVILGESRRVLRHRPGVLIVEHKLGFVVANAGVDQSNVDPDERSATGIAAAREPGCVGAAIARAIPAAAGQGSGRRHQRQFRACVAARHSRRRARRCRLACLDKSARHAGSLRAPPASQRNRIRRRNRRSGLVVDGAGE